MSNTLTNLLPDAYKALDVVSRELVGFIPAVARDSTADQVAIGQTLRSPVSPANSASDDITPAMALPTAAYQSIGNKTLTISKSRFAPFSWTGAEQTAMDAGPGFLNLRQDQIAQAMRTLVNEMEVDLAAAANAGASRAYGTVTTVPFASNLGESAQVRKILDDNGAPISDRSLVLSTTAGANLRTLLNNPLTANAQLANQFGAQGVLLNTNGFAFRESAQIKLFTAGTMASATSTSAAFTIGQTVIPLATAGTGVVAAGDVVTFANDTNKYVVSAVSFASTNPASGDSITLAAPGLRKAQGVATRAITVIATGNRNIGLRRNAIVLATRLPEMPAAEGSSGILMDRQVITDPLSGLSFELTAWGGFRMVTYHVSINWGIAVIKPEHMAVLLE